MTEMDWRREIDGVSFPRPRDGWLQLAIGLYDTVLVVSLSLTVVDAPYELGDDVEPMGKRAESSGVTL
jgi:hypothetical protein